MTTSTIMLFKYNAKSTYYVMVIVVGVAITGYIAYTILSVSIYFEHG